MLVDRVVRPGPAGGGGGWRGRRGKEEGRPVTATNSRRTVELERIGAALRDKVVVPADQITDADCELA
jgi:hypothetical protein